MIIEIKDDENIPSGLYVLWNPDKIQRAKDSLPNFASDRDILIKYDEIGGLIVKDGIKLQLQTLYNLEKRKLNESVENLSDAQLLTIIRKAENTDISGSRYQKANTEWQIRQQNKLIEATKSKGGGIFFEVGGNMKNDGVIQTSENATVNIAVAGDYASQKGKIIQSRKTNNKKAWYEKPIGIVILMIIGGLIITGIAYWLGWN